MNALAEVLIGRDRVPSWRSERTRRAAILLGWLGWLGLAASTLADRGNSAAARAAWPHGTAVLGWLAIGFAVAAALPLAPRSALLAWRIAFAGVLVTPLIPGQNRTNTGYYALLAVTLVVAGLRYGPRHLWWMYALSLIPVWVWTGPDWVYPAVDTGWLALLAAAVHGAANWRRDRQALATQARQTKLERERNAALEERARIAREMHDVVAHHMSLIAVQAETAPYRLGAATAAGDGESAAGLPEPVAAEFAALSAAAREALTQMRGLLGVLRSDPGDNSNKRSAVERAPQPQLEDLPELVVAARRAGARVTLDMPEPASTVPPGVGLAAYRIVQESLSNAGRHSPGATVSVAIEEAGGSVRVTVRNAPATAPRRDRDGTGHGLAGMRERAALLGGTLDAGPTADGGFAVRAVLPAGEYAARPAGGPAPRPAGGPR